MKKRTYILLAVLITCLGGYWLYGGLHAELKTTPFDHFQDQQQIVSLIIETDLDLLMEEKEDYDYQPVQLTLKKSNCLDQHFHIEAKPRGVFRKANCAFPPLKLRFPDKVLAAGGFGDYPTLKLVTHCQEDPSFDQLIIKEYLVFKLYNILTTHSFRTQLVQVTYRDSRQKHADFERFGFLIEHPRELADRMNAFELGEQYGEVRTIHLPSYKVFTVFQYMIGNTDWGLKNRHNVKLMQPRTGTMKLPVPVPYDFDFCGLVNAPYAIPHESLPIQEVTQRYFQWYGGEEDFTEVFQLFREKKDQLYTVFRDCTYLEDSVKQECIAYLDSFFQLLDAPAEITAGSQ